jgi:hypothetical protein
MKVIVYTIEELFKAEGRGGYGEARVSLRGLGTPGTGQFRPLGGEEKKRVLKEKKERRKEEKAEDIKAYGHSLEEEKEE